MAHAFAERLRAWPQWLAVSGERVRLTPEEESFAGRTAIFAKIVHALHQAGLVNRIMDEPYPVTAQGRNQPLATIDRASSSAFGLRAYGQHLNGYVRTDTGIKMWIARRHLSRGNEPGKLDQMVAGGLPHGIALVENLRKECHEEALIPAELAARAQAVGTLTYCVATQRGLRPDTIYLYDLELPAGFVPQQNDDEVEEFLLLPVDEVAALVRDTDSFKRNCNLVVIDFLIRHGLIDPEERGYEELVSGLHPRLP